LAFLTGDSLRLIDYPASSCPQVLSKSYLFPQQFHRINHILFYSLRLYSNSNPAPKHSALLWFVCFHRHMSSGLLNFFLLIQSSTSRVSRSNLAAGCDFRFYSSDSTLPHSFFKDAWSSFPASVLSLRLVSLRSLVEINSLTPLDIQLVEISLSVVTHALAEPGIAHTRDHRHCSHGTSLASYHDHITPPVAQLVRRTSLSHLSIP
jgi:hypothetical protein